MGLAFVLLSQTLLMNMDSTLQDGSQQGFHNPVLASSGGGGPSLALVPGMGGGGPRLKNGSQNGTSILIPGSGGGGPRLAFGAGGDRPNKAVSPLFAEQNSMMLIRGGGGGPRLAFGAGNDRPN